MITREQIIKEARKQLKGIVPCEWDQQPFIDIFVDAAEWRINSVWHDMKEKPDFKKLPVLLKHKSGVIHFIDSTPASWRYLIKHYVKWAYIEDLLPNMEDK